MDGGAWLKLALTAPLLNLVNIIGISVLPYRATGLEWQTSSPPPTNNFEKIPVVTEEPYAYHKIAPQGSTVISR